MTVWHAAKSSTQTDGSEEEDMVDRESSRDDRHPEAARLKKVVYVICRGFLHHLYTRKIQKYEDT